MKYEYFPESLTLSFYSTDGSRYGVCWHTETVGTPIFEYTLADDIGFERAMRVRGRCEEFNGMIRNTAETEDLMAGESYIWRIGDECGGFSETYSFRAVDSSADGLSFLVFADTQDGSHFGEWWVPAWKDAVKRFPDASFMLHAGDIVQDGGDREQWKRMLGINRGIVTSLPMLPTAGNHEFAAHHFRSPKAKWVNKTLGAESDGYANIYSHYNIDVPKQDIERGIYYSADVGPLHITVLDSGDAEHMNYCGFTEEQIKWALEDIAASDKDWKLVMLHTPMYSPGKYGSRSDLMANPKRLRETFNKTFAEHGVDLVVSAHDHLYSETYPIMADGIPDNSCTYVIKKVNGKYYRLAVDPRGPIHMLPGCAGNQNRWVDNEIEASECAAYRDMIDTPSGCVSYAAIQIERDTLTVDYVLNRVDGGDNLIIRRFGIMKSK